MQHVKGFLINLDNREDRLAEAASQFHKIPFQVDRVSAILASDIESKEPFVPGGVAATWRSHQKAMRAHLDSSFEFAIILEDDFVVNFDIQKVLNKILTIGDFDLVQFGYLNTSFLRRFFRYLIGCRDLLLKIICKIASVTNWNILNKLIVREQKNIPFGIVLNDIQAGGQSYLVSRKFSEASQFMNNPSFLSADGMLMALSETRTFKVGRTRRNYFSQSDSVSSVQQRFNNSFEN